MTHRLASIGLTIFSFAFAQSPAATPPAPDIASAWDQIIAPAAPGAAPGAAPDPIPAGKRSPARHGTEDDFLNHFFFESRTTYERYQTYFTGHPTNTGVINAPDTGIFNPVGIPFTGAFQPSADRIQTFMNFGTRGYGSEGYGSERISTHFALRYRQNLSTVADGSPSQNILGTFHGRRLFELLDANVEITGKPEDGLFAGTSLQLGRLTVYGAEVASFDGGAETLSRPRYDLTVFGGRRFSYFSDPRQRAIGGVNLILKFDPSLSVELETLWYVKGSNRIVLRKRLRDRWLISSYLRSYGGAPVDFEASGLYSSFDGKTTLRTGFFQKLTDKDYTYDYTSEARDLAAKNPLYRIYLGPIEQYSQINMEAHRQFVPRLRGGGALTVRRLNDNNTQGAFETSFADYRFDGQIFPHRGYEMFLEYHQRDSDRLSPATSSAFDDIRAAGETSVKDLSAELCRSSGEGRVNLSGGMYYRRINFQDRFYRMNGLHQSGVLASASLRVDRHTRAYFNYSLDNDFFLFAPDIKNSQVFRLGVNWKY